jgi:hypothetical protein
VPGTGPSRSREGLFTGFGSDGYVNPCPALKDDLVIGKIAVPDLLKGRFQIHPNGNKVSGSSVQVGRVVNATNGTIYRLRPESAVNVKRHSEHLTDGLKEGFTEKFKIVYLLDVRSVIETTAQTHIAAGHFFQVEVRC